jgi:hypothetical protein
LPPGAAPGTVPTDLEQATGLERLEILGKMQGIDIFDMSPLPSDRVGTFDDPIVVKSAGDEFQLGCTGCPADSHVVRWLVVGLQQAFCKKDGQTDIMSRFHASDHSNGAMNVEVSIVWTTSDLQMIRMATITVMELMATTAITNLRGKNQRPWPTMSSPSIGTDELKVNHIDDGCHRGRKRSLYIDIRTSERMPGEEMPKQLRSCSPYFSWKQALKSSR